MLTQHSSQTARHSLAAAAAFVVITMNACTSHRSDDAHSLPADKPQIALRNPEFLEQYAATRGFTHGTPKNISITPDGAAVLFLRSGPHSFVQDLFIVDTATGNERVLLTADQILSGKEEHLTAEELARRERMRLASRGIASYALSKDGKQILVPLSGRLFVVALGGTGLASQPSAPSIKELKSEAGYPIDPQFSPDGTMVACVREGDLYVTNISTGQETRLTTKAGPTITNGLAEFVAQEEMDRFRGLWWSPDSKQIAYEQADTAGMETFHIADPVSPDKAAAEWPYPRPGRKNASVRLGVINVTGGPTLWIDWNYEQYPYLARVAWPKDSPLGFAVLNRAQTELVIHESMTEDDRNNLLSAPVAALPASASVGTAHAAVRHTETDAAWVNLFPNLPKWLPGRRFIHAMEGGGQAGLHLRMPSGFSYGLNFPLTSDLRGVQGFVAWSDETSQLFVTASEDPTQTHVYAVADGKTTRLTVEPGVHSMILADDSDWCVQSSMLLDGRNSWFARRWTQPAPGIELKATRETPPWIPNLTLTTCGSRDFHAAIIRPRDFDASKKYPVIVSVYGGPHHQMVRANPHLYFREQWMADQGFIVCCIDGRGTPGRGRDWERAIKNDLIGPALEDQIDGLKSLGTKYPEMDMNRVGIYGWSFGGYFSAMAAMQRPDVFKAACAGAPVCDWLDYDTCYTERYLGVPALNKDGQPESAIYTKSSVLTYCKDLKVPLLIIHGTADDNVYFMHSLKMTQSLFREGKDFEFLPLAGFTHMVPDPVVTTRLYSRVAEFFIKNLGAMGN